MWGVDTEAESVPKALEEGTHRNTEGEGFEPPKACTLVVFKPHHPAAEYENRLKAFPQWGFHH